MTTDVMQWVISQGIGAVLAAVMFFIYRQDAKTWAAKQTETATAFMEFGERYSRALADVSSSIAKQALILDRIDKHLAQNHLCPVTQVTTELLRETAEEDGPTATSKHRAIDRLIREALAARVKKEESQR